MSLHEHAYPTQYEEIGRADHLSYEAQVTVWQDISKGAIMVFIYWQ